MKNFMLDCFLDPLFTMREVAQVVQPENLEVKFPGVKKENISIKKTIEGNILRLSISGVNKRGKTLSETIDIFNNKIDCENITAELEDGILYISLPKKEGISSEIKIS